MPFIAILTVIDFYHVEFQPLAMKTPSQTLPIQISSEHIISSQKCIVFRGKPSTYLRYFKNYFANDIPLLDFLVASCEASNHSEALLEPESYILIEIDTLEKVLEKADLPRSRGIMISRFKTLIEKDLATLHVVSFQSTKINRVYEKQCYIFRTPLDLESLISESDHQSPSIKDKDQERGKVMRYNQLKRQELLRQNSILPQSILSTMVSYNTVILLKQWMTFGQAWRLSVRSANPTEQTILHIGKHKCPIYVTAPPEVGIPSHDDQLVLAVLLNYCSWIIRHQKDLGNDVTNSFIIDILDICNLVASWKVQSKSGFDKLSKEDQETRIKTAKRNNSTGSARKVLVRSLYRLRLGAHFINLDNSEASDTIRRHLGLKPGANRYTFTFLDGLDAHDDKIEGAANYEPRWFSIRLDDSTFKALMEGFKSRDSLTVLGDSKLMGVAGSSGLLILLYQMLNVYVGRNAYRGDNLREYTVEQLHLNLAPRSIFTEFIRFLNNAVQALYESSTARTKWSSHGINRCTALGYHMSWITIDDSIVSAEFSRDREDHITGDKSLHNKHRFKEIMGALESDADTPFQGGLFDQNADNS